MKKKLPAEPVTIPIVGEIDGETMLEVMAGILEAGTRDLRIVICSPGGQAEPTFGIHDLLVNAARGGRRVIVEVWGEAASAAAVILQAGTWRRMSPHSRMLIHNPSGHGGDPDAHISAHDLKVELKGLQDTTDTVVELLSGRSKQKPDIVRSWMLAETSFTPREALTTGYIDEIIKVFP